MINFENSEITNIVIHHVGNKFEDGAVVDTAALLKAGILNETLDGVKILGDGEITKKLTVKAKIFSASAKEKIEAAGGKTEVV